MKDNAAYKCPERSFLFMSLNYPFRLLAVDLQFDFTRKEGKHFNPKRKSPEFVRRTLLPFIKRNQIPVAEIISDYRQPRPGDLDSSCIPGTLGYASELSPEVAGPRWIKCMNSPLFTRDGVGAFNVEPGLPRIDAPGFMRWIDEVIGKPDPKKPIILFGLTLDCCVLCTAQILRMLGYEVQILSEGTDTYRGGPKARAYYEVVSNWATLISFREFKKLVVPL
jgi:hypothetical protein